jgi:hypothetical protein
MRLLVTLLSCMAELDSMSATGGVAASKVKGNLELDPDSRVVPIQLPKRLPYRPSIPASKLKQIVSRVAKEREAEERHARNTAPYQEAKYE